MEKIYSVSVLLIFYLLEKVNCSNIDFFLSFINKNDEEINKKNPFPLINEIII